MKYEYNVTGKSSNRTDTLTYRVTSTWDRLQSQVKSVNTSVGVLENMSLTSRRVEDSSLWHVLEASVLTSEVVLGAPLVRWITTYLACVLGNGALNTKFCPFAVLTKMEYYVSDQSYVCAQWGNPWPASWRSRPRPFALTLALQVKSLTLALVLRVKSLALALALDYVSSTRTMLTFDQLLELDTECGVKLGVS